MSILIWFAIGVFVLWYSGLLGETVKAIKVVGTKILDFFVPREKRALEAAKAEQEQKKRDLEKFEHSLDEYGGKLKRAMDKVEIAKTKMDEAATEAREEKTTESLVAFGKAKAEFQRLVAIAQEYKAAYDRLEPQFNALREEIESSELEVDKKAAEVVLTDAHRLGNDLQKHVDSLKSDSTRPNENFEIISEALATEQHRAERMAGQQPDPAKAAKKRERHLNDLAAELGIEREGAAPAATDEATAALPAPTEQPMPIVTETDKVKVEVPVERNTEKKS